MTPKNNLVDSRHNSENGRVRDKGGVEACSCERDGELLTSILWASLGDYHLKATGFSGIFEERLDGARLA